MKTLIKEKSFVDVILPNRNKAAFLEEAINSVIAQTYKNWHLYIIDDYSTDNSEEIINKFSNLKNITIIKLYKNKRQAFCRNYAMRVSKSKYISFLDSDDIWVSNKLEKQISFMEKNNLNFTYTNYTPFVIKNNKKFFRKEIIAPNSFNYDQFIKNSSIGMSSVIIKRSIIGTTRFRKFYTLEDYLFKCKVLKKVSTAINLNSNTMFYRISKNSAQSNKLRILYLLWHINKNHNKLNFFANIISILFISINSIKKYGFK